MSKPIQLHTLGNLQLTCNSLPLPLLHRPRRFALFAFLVLSPSRIRSREALQATFWPECNLDQARRSLNTALYALRQELGHVAIESRGQDSIVIAADKVWCDARAFDEAISTKDYARALDLYVGDLMPAFFIRGAPEFERWLEDERGRLRRAAHEAAWTLAERAEKDGNSVEAVERARKAVQLSLDDEILVQRSIRLLDRIGDRVGAIEVFQRFARHLKKEYDAVPAPETQRLIGDVRARVVSLSPANAFELPAAMVYAAVPSHLSAGALPPIRESVVVPARVPNAAVINRAQTRFPVRSRALMGAIAAGIVTTGAFALLAWPNLADSNWGPQAERPEVVVSELESHGAQPDQIDLAPAITAAITQQLAQVSTIELITEGALAAHVRSVARRKKATRPVFQVKGSVVSSRERVRVNVELIDVTTGNILKASTVERSTDDLRSLIDDAARSVGAFLRAELGRDIQLRRWRAGTKNIRARELLERAELYRRRAKELEESGSYAAAATGFKRADSLLVLAEREEPAWIDPTAWRVRVASDAAWLLFLPPLQDTAGSLGWIRTGVAHADRVLRRASSNATVLELRGTLLYWQSLMASGVDEASRMLRQSERDLRTAVSVDPERPRAWTLLSALLRARGDFANAYWAAQHAYTADAHLESTEEIVVRLGLTAFEIGGDSVAWEWCATLDERTFAGAYCRLNILAWIEAPGPGAPINAWTVIDRLPRDRTLNAEARARLEMLAATVLGRRGLVDSAKVVIQRAARRQPMDDELLLLEAGARVAIGDNHLAVELLRHYVSADPAHRTGSLRSRRFQPIKDLLSANFSATQ